MDNHESERRGHQAAETHILADRRQSEERQRHLVNPNSRNSIASYRKHTLVIAATCDFSRLDLEWRPVVEACSGGL